MKTKTIFCIILMIAPFFAFSQNEITSPDINLNPTQAECRHFSARIQSTISIALAKHRKDYQLDTIGKITNLYVLPKNGLRWSVNNPPKNPFMMGIRVMCCSLFNVTITSTPMIQRIQYVTLVSEFTYRKAIPYNLIDKIIVETDFVNEKIAFTFDDEGNAIYTAIETKEKPSN